MLRDGYYCDLKNGLFGLFATRPRRGQAALPRRSIHLPDGQASQLHHPQREHSHKTRDCRDRQQGKMKRRCIGVANRFFWGGVERVEVQHAGFSPVRLQAPGTLQFGRMPS